MGADHEVMQLKSSVGLSRFHETKVAIVIAAVGCLSVASAGCAADNADSADSDDGPRGGAAQVVESTLDIEAQLVQFGIQSTYRANAIGADAARAAQRERSRIDAWVGQLRSNVSAPELTDPRIFGAWRRVWSDFNDPVRTRVTVDPNNTYVVLAPPASNEPGHFWLLGNARGRIGTLKMEAVGAIRVDFTVGEDPTPQKRGQGLLGTFVQAGFSTESQMNGNQRFDSLMQDFARSGGLLTSLVPKAPEGPIGIRAFLQPVYVNPKGTLLVLRADQLEFGTPGASNNPQQNKLFVLTRATVPELSRCESQMDRCEPGQLIPTQDACALANGNLGRGTAVCSTACVPSEFPICQ